MALLIRTLYRIYYYYYYYYYIKLDTDLTPVYLTIPELNLIAGPDIELYRN